MDLIPILKSWIMHLMDYSLNECVISNGYIFLDNKTLLLVEECYANWILGLKSQQSLTCPQRQCCIHYLSLASLQNSSQVLLGKV